MDWCIFFQKRKCYGTDFHVSSGVVTDVPTDTQKRKNISRSDKFIMFVKTPGFVHLLPSASAATAATSAM